MNPALTLYMFFVSAFLLYTLQVAVAFGMLSSVYGDFMQVCWSIHYNYTGVTKAIIYTLLSVGWCI